MLMTLVFTLLSKKIWCVCVCAVRKYLFSNMLHELLHMSYNNRLLTAHERASEKLGNNKAITEKTHLYRLQKYIREYWFSNTNQPESKEKKKKKKKKKQTPAFMSVSEWVFLDLHCLLLPLPLLSMTLGSRRVLEKVGRSRGSNCIRTPNSVMDSSRLRSWLRELMEMGSVSFKWFILFYILN
jgi:hypothetical protein